VLRDLKYRIRGVFLRTFALFSIAFIRILPIACALALVRGIARIFPLIQPYQMRGARRSVKLALKIESQKEIERIVRESLLHLGYTVVEFIKMGYSTSDYVKSMCVEERGGGVEKVRSYLERGKGLIGLGMHLGNWEMSGAYIAVNGITIYAVGKPQRDDFFSKLAFPWRERHGIINIYKASGKIDMKIVRALKSNSVLALISDQNGGHDGVFAPMFGIESSTIEGSAALHLKFHSPLVPVVAWRIAPGKLVLEVFDEIDTADILLDQNSPTPRWTHEERAREVLTRINAAYERIIREHPEQWLWIHRRFKTRPEGEPDRYL
jgi:Kdo2-lipid IVA lauroyltransferase/acyltransferase